VPVKVGWREKCKNEGSSGDVDENKEEQVSGVRTRIGNRLPRPREPAARKSAKMKVHPGMLMKTKKGRFQVSGARCQGANRERVAELQGEWP